MSTSRIGLGPGGALALSVQVDNQQAVAKLRHSLRIGDIRFLGAEHIGKEQDARAPTSLGIGDNPMLEGLSVNLVYQRFAQDGHDRLRMA